MQKKSRQGFTLLETLLVVALIALASAITMPIYRAFQVRNDFSIATQSFAQATRRAQMLAKSSMNDSSWSVLASSTSVTVFKGSDYVGRDTSYDEIFDVYTNITATGTSQFTFAKFTGIPTATGSVTLTSSINESSTITINEQGTVTY